jgi:hypothetical protein
MVNFKKKATIVGTAALALGLSAGAQAAYVLMPNGDFSAGSANWGTFADFGGGSTVSFETAGGNPGGYGLASNTAGGWGGGFVQEALGTSCIGAGGGAAACGLALSDYGLFGGDTTTFRFDVNDFVVAGGQNIAIKLESWSATNYISDTGDIAFATSGGWETRTQSYTFDPAATHFKVVLVGVNAGQVGFDNLYIDAAVVPVPAAVWLFGSGLLGLIGVARKKKAA